MHLVKKGHTQHIKYHNQQKMKHIKTQSNIYHKNKNKIKRRRKINK